MQMKMEISLLGFVVARVCDLDDPSPKGQLACASQATAPVVLAAKPRQHMLHSAVLVQRVGPLSLQNLLHAAKPSCEGSSHCLESPVELVRNHS